jgi:hypothetical protein
MNYLMAVVLRLERAAGKRAKQAARDLAVTSPIST